jgi:hypothetical protein
MADSERSERTISKDELTKLLAPSLGQEKSDEVVLATARSLGFSPPFFSAAEVRSLFETLSKAEGLIGVVARFAVSRGDVDVLVERALTQSTRNPRAQDPSSTKLRVAAVDLLPLLAPALGTEKARDAVTTTAHRLRLNPQSLTRDQALSVLDELACTEGIVGVVARFAKARFLLEA